jgi:hypothetical protein
LSSGNHKLTVKEIRDYAVDILIESNPTSLTLVEGQSEKINLSSPYYYDLFIKLNNIENNEINLTIKRIVEEIITDTRKEDKKNGSEKVYYIMNTTNDKSNMQEKDDYFLQYYIIFIASSVLLIWIILKQMNSYDKHERSSNKSHKVSRTKRSGRKIKNGKKTKAKTKRKR